MSATDEFRAGAAARRYHEATNHTPEGVADQYAGNLDPELRPRLDKRYPTVPALPLPADVPPSSIPALDAIAEPTGRGATPAPAVDRELVARLCFLTDGITKRLRRGDRVYDFRAAPCTGALYHMELYLVAGELAGLPAGVFHYGVHDHALRRLRDGDFRAVLAAASGGDEAIAAAPAVMVVTSVFWRNAWKYANRAFRHTFWDVGTMLPNTLAVAAAAGLPARLVLGFADGQIADLLGLDLEREGVVALVPFGRTDDPPPPAPPVAPLDLPTEPYSVRELDFPLIRQTYRATLLADGDEAAAWRRTGFAQPRSASGASTIALPATASVAAAEPIEAVIRRRGSTRRFAGAPIALDQLSTLLDRTTRGIPSDALGPDGIPLNDAYLIVNAVEGLPPGAYRYRREGHALEPLRTMTEAAARERSFYLAWEQDLGGDAAVNVYFLADLDPILATHGDRGYRLAHLGGALVAGKLYLAAYALGLGATGLTFYDDEVTKLFSPPAAGTSVMFLIAIGRPATG